ncbi:MAG: hypothetical protein BWY54_00112 [Candidatus Dependentiae bacterium ADurb.Bin331]|nr:MAG: hypothetical protein BWY54_00112 [Candidatus Dependentiae bacterium ADurb.Bin331]
MNLLLPALSQAVSITTKSFTQVLTSLFNNLPLPSIEARNDSLLPKIVISNNAVDMQTIALPSAYHAPADYVQLPTVKPVEFAPAFDQLMVTANPQPASWVGSELINYHQTHDAFFSSYEQCINLQNEMIDQARLNGTLGQLTSRVNEFFSWLYALNRSDMTGTNARLLLADIKPPLPLLEFYFAQFKKEICHYVFNSDWSVKTQLSGNDSYRIAQLSADLIKNGVGSFSGKRFIEHGCKLHSAGFNYLSGNASRSLIESCKSAASHFFTFGNFRPKMVFKNEFNKICSQINGHLVTGNFGKAFECVQSLPANDPQAKQLLSFYQEAYGAQYNRFGVAHCYENDPYFQRLLPTLQPQHVPQAALNQTLAFRAQLYESLYKTIGVIGNPSPLVHDLLYYLVDHYSASSTNVTDIITHFCERLSGESNDLTIKDAYHIFFNDQGVLRLTTNYSFKKTAIPAPIHTDAYKHEKVLLNLLAHLNHAEATTRQHIDCAVNYIVNGCTDKHLTADYRTLAHEITRALVDPHADKTILSCGDFSRVPVAMQLTAHTLRQRDNCAPASAQYEKMNTLIRALDKTCTDIANGTFTFEPKKMLPVVAPEHKQTLVTPQPPTLSTAQQPPAQLESRTWLDTFISWIAGGLMMSSMQAGLPSASPPRIPHSTIPTQQPSPHTQTPVPEESKKPVLGDSPAGHSVHPERAHQNSLDKANETDEATQEADDAEVAAPRFPRCGQASGMPLFFQEMQKTPANAAQKATTKSEPDCIEQANKLPEFAQIVLAEKANAYFRAEITKYEAQIVHAIEQKLKEQNITHPYPIVINDINMKHIMFAEWSKRRQEPTGLHSARWSPERINKITIPEGLLGTYEAEVQLHCKHKNSTFFPNTWDENVIIDKIIESFFMIDEIKVRTDAIRLWGFTKEGIKIEITLLNSGKIVTAYPARDGIK